MSVKRPGEQVCRFVKAAGDPDVLDCDGVVCDNDVNDSDGQGVLDGARAPFFENAYDGEYSGHQERIGGCGLASPPLCRGGGRIS